MAKILKYFEYINEQKDSSKAKFATDVATTLFKTAMGIEGDSNYSNIAETEETKKSMPYTGCGSTAYPFKPIELTNKKIIDLFVGNGKFSSDINYVELKKQIESKSNKMFILGVREYLDTKIKEGDKFIDKIAIIDPLKPNDKIISYSITTCPSVSYYSDPDKAVNLKGLAIVQPGAYKYKIGIHKPNSANKHEALIQGGDIQVLRYKIGDKKSIDTYKPAGEIEKGELGINIHRGSTNNGVCVGPYSAGCQVFANGTDFDAFMSKIKSAPNGGDFIYALVENDSFAKPTSETNDDKSEKTKKEKSSKKSPIEEDDKKS